MNNSMEYDLGSHCTNSDTKLPEQSWLVPRHFRAGQKEPVPLSYPQQCPGEPKARRERVPGSRRWAGLAGAKGKESSTLHCAAEPEGGTGWEIHPGRGSEEEQRTDCTVEKKLRYSLTSHSD